MLIFRPDVVRRARRLAVLLTSLSGLLVAHAAPRMTGPPAPPPVVAVAPPDPLANFLVDRGMTVNAVAATPPEVAFVERMRGRAADMVLTAMNFLGVPYRRGGSSADRGFDCSGFTRHIFEMSIGLVLPRRADEQATTAGLLQIRRDELRPGDLVFFNTMRRTFSHVGIYLGEGKFIHSPKPGGEVRVDDMRATYWDQRYTGGRRAETLATVPATAVSPALAPTLN